MTRCRLLFMMIASSIVCSMSANPITLTLKGNDDKIAYNYRIRRTDFPLFNVKKQEFHQEYRIHVGERKAVDTFNVLQYSDLSKLFTYRVEVFRSYIKEIDIVKIHTIRIKVFKKSTKITSQEIEFKYEGGSFEDQFTDPKHSRSYITGARKNEEHDDWDYGDFVVNDFNFDGREDFAIKVDMGGRAGPYYEFYTAKADGTFSLDKFLTKSIGRMPEIDPVKKRLEISTILDASGDFRQVIYRYDTSQKKWLLVSNKIYRNNRPVYIQNSPK